MADSAWPTIHAERKALADDLSHLTDAQWQSPSLCEGWTIHQALAHQVSTAKMTPLGFVKGFAGAGFSFAKFAEKGVAAEVGSGPAATLAAFRAAESSTKSPPGPKDSWLGEAIVHAEDLRRPLGIAHAYPLPMVTRAFEFYAKSNTILPGKRRSAGLTWKATDVEWSYGEGPVVEGPAVSLLMAMTGRTTYLDDLYGPGVDELRSR